ncbi:MULTISPECIES: KilA-N domain-containing protein [unclassified Gilliamella]|uniref:KilA-N domain-containing protein n=1 Tax=unclassified Gilliamella TaxID=2685620 RepID=UPI001324BB55|nr:MULTISPECIES: KilA-N domain-containing protein [unclassified Gilliamella]MWN32124.1 KilA-N domain-containing protein [Gilliamella sp. Pra-s60]MWP29383.1 KilA-N domain-containing protein [Gilliamella sp. Pra-s54]
MKNSIKNNLSCPVIAGISITTDEQGRYNLNALHKASGGKDAKRPKAWLATKSTQELIEELRQNSAFGQEIITVTKGGINQGTFAHELLAISYAGWISPKFQLTVNQVFLDYKKGELTPTPKIDNSGLPELRKARAIKEVYNVAEKLCGHLSNLSSPSKQAIYAKLINPIAGSVVPYPTLDGQTYSAKEVGAQLGISGHKVGLIANKYNLKTAENGIFVLDKAEHSDKQVTNFRYNENGIKAIKSHMEV